MAAGNGEAINELVIRPEKVASSYYGEFPSNCKQLCMHDFIVSANAHDDQVPTSVIAECSQPTGGNCNTIDHYPPESSHVWYVPIYSYTL